MGMAADRFQYRRNEGALAGARLSATRAMDSVGAAWIRDARSLGQKKTRLAPGFFG